MELEGWQLVLAIAALIAALAGAAWARDRSISEMIVQSKEDSRKMVKEAVDPVHDRINRVRDEYVREDHMNAHLQRIEKRFDDMRDEIRTRDEQTRKSLDEIRGLLTSR